MVSQKSFGVLDSEKKILKILAYQKNKLSINGGYVFWSNDNK